MLRRFVSNTETLTEQLPGQINNWYFKDGLGDAENLVLVRGCLEKGSGHPFHTHPEMDEIIYVLSGEMRQWLEKESRIIAPGDTLYIPRGIIHGCRNESTTPCEFLAILTPAKITGPFSVDYSTQEPWRSLL